MTDQRVSTGIDGLDEVLSGGLIEGRTYLVSGPPGTGKTTLGWHFLETGARRGEAALYISFGEPEAELRANAARTGFDVDAVNVLDLSPTAELFARAETYDIFSPSEVEREPTTQRIVEAIGRVAPSRVFVDSMTHLRHLSSDTFHFRRQALSFLRFLADRNATVVVTSESTAETPDDDLRFISDGVIEVHLGTRAREVCVSKFRGSDFQGGHHAMRLSSTGATVFPRLLPESHSRPFEPTQLSSGIEQLDELLAGGIERGTVTIISGPTGVGKTTLGMQFMKEAAVRGERSAVYTFDERRETLLRRCAAIGIPVVEMMERGTLDIIALEALKFGPDEFANLVRRDVDQNGTRFVMIDSVSGYRISVSGDDLGERLHALGRYLQNVGVTLILVDELRDIMEFRVTDVGISYLADNVIFLRYVERMVEGIVELRKGIGVLKKRLSDFQKTVREFAVTSRGVQIGNALTLSSIMAQLPVDEGAHSRT
ncbi:MAG: ATPase domain-containing protein [Candidatus Elarobacter sp.]